MSEFVRFHPLRANHEAADDIALRHVQDTVTVDVTQDDDALMAQMASAGRTAVRKAAKAGVEPRPARDLDRFRDMYVETMRRVGAAERYLFSAEFFERLERMGDGVVMLDAGCAAGLFLAGGGAMHYFLSASTDEGRALSATNAVLFAAMRHAREAGLATLHLGGGLVDGDSLQRFKQSMGAGRAPFFVGSAIHDAGAYEELCAAAGGAGRRAVPGLPALKPAADHVRHLAAPLLPHVQAGEVPDLDRPVVGRVRRRRDGRRLAGVGHLVAVPAKRLGRAGREHRLLRAVIPVRHFPTDRVPIPAKSSVNHPS